MLGFGAEILLEVLFELVPSVFELVLEAISWLFDSKDDKRKRAGESKLDEEAGAAPQRAQWSPLVTGALMIVSLALGVWWGQHVLAGGQTYPPLTLWSLIVVGGAAAIVALTMEEPPTADVHRGESRWRHYLRFDRSRLTRIALLNLAGAVGIALGYYA